MTTVGMATTAGVVATTSRSGGTVVMIGTAAATGSLTNAIAAIVAAIRAVAAAAVASAVAVVTGGIDR